MVTGAAKKWLTDDSRWIDFVRRYCFDLNRFVAEVCGQTPTQQQIEIGENVVLAGSRTSVASGHGTGKTNYFSCIALWHLLCYRNSNTFITAPRLATVHDGVWKEFIDRKAGIEAGPHAWIADYLCIEHERVYVREPDSKLNWFITAKTAPTGRPENLAGAHRDWLLWLADEGSGIPDANYGVIGGSLTDKRNRFVIASQPTRPSGFFYNTHHNLSQERGGPWKAITLNSEESPLVSDEFIRDKRLEYGGRDAPEYQIKVLGRFPENSEKYLLGRKAIERLIDGPQVIHQGEAYGNVLIVDVGAGVFRDKTVATHVRMTGYGDRIDPDPRRIEVMEIPIFSNSMDWVPVARIVADKAATLSNCTVLVDVGGQGVQFAKFLEGSLDVPNVRHINWGDKCFKSKNKKRFFNQRAQCSVHAAEAVKDGRVRFISAHKSDLLDQGARIPFKFDDLARWKIMSKEDMAKENLPSPDLWDTICMAFLDNIHYIESSEYDLASIAPMEAIKSVRAAAADFFADV